MKKGLRRYIASRTSSVTSSLKGGIFTRSRRGRRGVKFI